MEDGIGARGTPRVVIPVSDLDRAICFYRDVLDLKVRRISRRTASVDLGGQTITLEEGSDTRNRLPLKHLAFEVESLEHACRLLRERGVTVASGGTYCPDVRKQAMVNDPDGNRIILIAND